MNDSPTDSRAVSAGWVNGPRFYSSNISGVQRLPNGNTLVTEGANGRLFEVASDRKIVWEYMYPLFGGAQSSKPARLPAGAYMFAAEI